MPDSTQRFSDRVENYIRCRPSYPGEIFDFLSQKIGLTAPAVVADIGSGTGISAELFLRRDHRVYGVEPNPEMRSAAERLLADYPKFCSIEGTAEETRLPSHSVDCVVAAQAFHWFDPEKSRREFARILKPAGWCILLWNTRRTDSTPFLKSYEHLLNTCGTDYREVQHTRINGDVLSRWFAPGTYASGTFYNEQRFDWDGLYGRTMSTSYVPAIGQPGYPALVDHLWQTYRDHQDQGQVCFEYDTEVHIGQLLPSQA